VVAFVAAHRQHSTTPIRRRHVPIPSLVASSIALKIAAGATVLSLGGIAYAAHEGSLPGTAQDAAHHLLGSVGVPAANDASDKGDGPDATGPAGVGLCRAFTAGENQHGSALDSVAFKALATAAGGGDQIEGYCRQVLADAGSHRPGQTPSAGSASTNVPNEPGQPSDLPTANAPTDPPTGPPSSLPTTDHPTGRPTATPSASH
jgi:hypothetical protein